MATKSAEDAYDYCPFNYVDQENASGIKAGQWRDTIENGGMLPMGQLGSNNYSKTAKETRDLFMNYFNSEEGSVSWQIDMVHRVSNPFDGNF